MLKRLNLGRGETIEVKIRGLNIPMVLRRSARARRFSLQVSEARRGGFHVLGFAGNSAPDHVDHLYALGEWLRRWKVIR